MDLVGIGLGTLPEGKHSLTPIGASGVLITLVGGSVLDFVDRGTPDLLADRVAALRILALSIAVRISAAEQEVVDVR